MKTIPVLQVSLNGKDWYNLGDEGPVKIADLKDYVYIRAAFVVLPEPPPKRFDKR